jgi:hypothetical protein
MQKEIAFKMRLAKIESDRVNIVGLTDDGQHLLTDAFVSHCKALMDIIGNLPTLQTTTVSFSRELKAFESRYMGRASRRLRFTIGVVL